MKTMFNLNELAQRIASDEATKADFIVPAQSLRMTDDLRLTSALGENVLTPMPATDLGHAQVCDFTPIPKPYYDLMRASDPKLLAANVNRWMPEKKPNERRMVRTLGGNVRALLSDSYRRIENLQ